MGLLAVGSGCAAQVAVAPRSGPVVERFVLRREPSLSHDAKLRLLRRRVKYVFVLFQENRSFDFYFGSYPGADGLFNRPEAEVAGYRQPIVNVDGSLGTVVPFRIPETVTDVNGKAVPLYPADLASVDHSHTGLLNKVDVGADGVARNDRYVLAQEGVTLDADGKPSRLPTLERKQMGELVMGHLDCDTAPFLWRWADRFALFDNFFATELGPSTPNAIAMIAGQVGETQWLLHLPPEDAKAGDPNPLPPRSGVPVIADPDPAWGARRDKEDQSKGSSVDPKTQRHAPNLTFATLPLSFMGGAARETTAHDNDPAQDLADIHEDIAKIAGEHGPGVPWGWYQQGYDHEPTDLPGRSSHKTYVAHHNGPAYFGYISNNPTVEPHLHGLGDFFNDVASRRLPGRGVFYVRGGYGNIQGWKPMDPNPRLAGIFSGNDDHPGYSDSQLSEALLAEEINAIAASPYWSQSVILIAYDESDGLFDHARPRFRVKDVGGRPLSQGPRVPFLLISPFAEAHVVSHEASEHSSIIRLVNELFGLTPLADLPDEARARGIGKERFGETELGPADDGVAGVGDLLSGFSDARLLGQRPRLPASYAEIPAAEVTEWPHMGGKGCAVLGIRPTDAGRANPVPEDFNPRPSTTPGLPRSGTWVP